MSSSCILWQLRACAVIQDHQSHSLSEAFLKSVWSLAFSYSCELYSGSPFSYKTDNDHNKPGTGISTRDIQKKKMQAMPTLRKYRGRRYTKNVIPRDCFYKGKRYLWRNTSPETKPVIKLCVLRFFFACLFVLTNLHFCVKCPAGL